MTQEEKCILRALRCYVQNEVLDNIPENFDWSTASKIAEHHALMGIVYTQLKAFSDTESMHLLQRGFLSDIFYSTCRESDYQELQAAFRRAGLLVVPFKGMVVSQYYPNHELRTMGDIDLCIRPEDRMKVHELMIELGFEYKVDIPSVWTYHRDVISYEIHDHMFYEQMANSVDYQSYFDHVWEHVDSAGRIEPEFHFLYLIAHTAKHIINQGNGIRPFLDMAFLVRREQLDWKWIEQELEKLKLLPFARVCFALCERWLQTKMPWKADISEELYQQLTEKVLCDGIFGFGNEENSMASFTKQIKRSRLPYGLAAFKLTIQKLFPSYGNMQPVPKYSFLKGRPWLLPAAWVYRWGYTAAHKFRYGCDFLLEPIAKRTVVEKREKLLQDWGL